MEEKLKRNSVDLEVQFNKEMNSGFTESDFSTFISRSDLQRYSDFMSDDYLKSLLTMKSIHQNNVFDSNEALQSEGFLAGSAPTDVYEINGAANFIEKHENIISNSRNMIGLYESKIEDYVHGSKRNQVQMENNLGESNKTQIFEATEKGLNSLIEGENRNYKVGSDGDIINVVKRAGELIVRDHSIDGIIQFVGDAKSVTADMMRYGNDIIQIQADNWKSTNKSLKDVAKQIDGLPTDITRDQLNANVSRYRVVGKNRLEFQLQGQDKVQSLKLDHPPYLDKQTKELLIDQLSNGVVQSQNLNMYLGR